VKQVDVSIGTYGVDPLRRGGSVTGVTTLAERLGFASDDRVLIITCDDLGLSHATNVGVYEALRTGVATSATLMVPCPWAREAASRHRGEDVGVQLTLNAEFDRYRWGPITHAPSLLDGDGGFPRTPDDLWDHADLDEVRRELRAQIERAILWGFDITHLSSHLGTLQRRPEFFDLYLDLAVDFRLPLRLGGAAGEQSAGFPFRRLAAEDGVVFPDHFTFADGIGSRRQFEKALHDLQPGVTELSVHPAIDTPEIRSFAPEWPGRVDDLHLLCFDKELPRTLERAGVHLISYRPLRDLQRPGD
jgi:hypothetical protein